MLDRFHYGVCYYPEHWPAGQHRDDIRRIADAGFSFVRLGEGAWWYWEPREGEYRFDLFDRVIDLCRRAGLKVVLGTPTYAAPAWVSHRYPEVLRWDFRRTPMAHGSRRNLNYTSPRYLELSDRLCAALGSHYAKERQVIAWQLDNEFNCHMDVSYAPSDSAAFRAWLKRKYRTIDRLNEAWGARFWSQVYDDWEQVDLPAPTATYHNPTQLLDETRFISDCVVAFARRQAEILRAYNPKWRITHNGLFPNVDGPALVRGTPLDFFSHDQYPLFYKDWPSAAAGLVTARSLSFPFGVMEQQSGPGGQMQYLHRTPRPGEMRLWAFQSVAHGANLLSYFCWQTCPFGSEQHWHGLIDADGRDTRRLSEAKRFGEELRGLPRDFFTARPARVAAVLRDFDNEASDRRISTYNASGQWEQHRWLGALSRAHVPSDFAWSGDDWRGYKLLIAPHLQMIDAALARRMRAFARAGGMVVLGAQSGAMDRNGHVVKAPLPGLLRALAGVDIEDWTTLPPEESREAAFADGQSIRMGTFVERLRPARGTEVLAHWWGDDALLQQAPAVTLRRCGRGRVLYVGGYLPTDAVQTLVERLIRLLALRQPVQAGPEVEVIERIGARRRYLALLNHAASPREVTLPDARHRATVLMGDAKQSESGLIHLPPHAIAVLALSTNGRGVGRSSRARHATEPV